MTLQALSQHLKLRERLSQAEQTLLSLEDAASPGAQRLTGMPHSPGVKDKVGDLAVEIADMKERIRYLREAVADEEQAVQAFIDAIDNEQLRMSFRLHFMRCCTWGEVALVIGGRNTEYGVKSACYRYLDSQSCNDVPRCDA